MNQQKLLEKEQRGTDDFPFAYYKKTYANLHWHPEWELLYMISGVLSVTVAEENYILKEGDILFVNPDELHCFMPYCGNVEYHAAVFHAELFQFQKAHFFQNEFTNGITNGNIKFPRRICRQEESYRVIAPIVDQLFNQHIDSKVMIFADLIQLFSVLIEQKLLIEKKQKIIYKSSEDIKQCIRYMEENYAEKITLSEIADLVHMTPNYFCSYFKKVTGLPPFTQLNHIRIKRASELLKQTEMTVNEIAEACGFNNVNYFIRKFKEIKECTPAVYRKKIVCNRMKSD